MSISELRSKPSHRLPYSTLIHENFSLVITYAFSKVTLEKWLDRKFHGEWKYLRRICFDVSEERVNRALLELAILLRLLDDKENISEYYKSSDQTPLGKVVQKDGTEEPLFFRDMTNKILHSSGFSWDFSDPDNPILKCHSDEPKWREAEVYMIQLAALCGGLMG